MIFPIIWKWPIYRLSIIFFDKFFSKIRFRDKKAQNCIKKAKNDVKISQNCVKNAQNGVKKAQNKIRKAPKNIKKALIASKVIKYQFCTNTLKYKPSRVRIRTFIPQYPLQWRSRCIYLCLTCSQVVLLTTDFISSTIALSLCWLCCTKSLWQQAAFLLIIVVPFLFLEQCFQLCLSDKIGCNFRYR